LHEICFCMIMTIILFFALHEVPLIMFTYLYGDKDDFYPIIDIDHIQNLK